LVKRSRAGLAVALYVAACVLPGEPSGAERIAFQFDFARPYMVPMAGTVAPAIRITAGGQALNNPPYRLESLDEGVLRVDSTGRGLEGVARGSAFVRVLYQTATGAPDTVFSVQVVVSRIAVSSAATNLTRLGATAHLSATAYDAKDALVPNVAFTWSSADSHVATVDDTGLVTAVGEGMVAITAEADTVKELVSVTVSQIAALVRLAPELDTLRTVGRSIQLIAVAFDSSNNVLYTARPRWTSSDSTVARVDSTGRATATGAGTARIVARVGAAADTTTLVVAQVVRYLVVTPGFDTLTAIAETTRIVALALDSLNFPVPTPTITWATSDATIAPVDGTGLVTAATNGVVLVTVSNGSQSAFATVVVRQQIAAARVSQHNVALTGPGDTVRLSAVAVDRNGFAVDRATFTWRSSNGFVATVDTAGLVRARVDGTVDIVATSRMGGRPDTATVSVTGAPRPPELIAFWGGCSWANDDACNLEVIAADGSGRSVVVGNARYPAWSRDGARLAYTNVFSRGIEYVEFAGSQPPRILTDNRSTPFFDEYPAWSPDGTKIAFRRMTYEGFKIWVVNADGSNARQLDVSSLGAFGGHPTWSPDGTKLAFASWSDRNNENFILVMNADGSGPIDTLPAGGWPAWSPDGSQLVFSDVSSGIVLMNPDGSGRSVLTRGIGWANAPAWSPDGTQIVFTSQRSVAPWDVGLFVINRDGTGLKALLTWTDHDPPIWDPVWGQGAPAMSARLRARP
jgi:uncharacterized protein YjdB